MTTINGPAVLDINTQYDLFNPHGGYPLQQAAQTLPALRKLFAWLDTARIPVVSTRLHGVVMPDPKHHAPICLAGTRGYAKLSFTMLPAHLELPIDCGTDLPVGMFTEYRQYIFDLPTPNPFDSPRLDRLLSETDAGLWITAGGPLESSVRMAVLGLIQRRQKVAIVKDGFGLRDPYEGDMTWRQLASKNIEWLTVDEVINRFTRRPRLSAAGFAGRRFGRRGRQPASLLKYRSPARSGSSQVSRYRMPE
jgi:nicotinamidase-related amidase